MKMKEKSSKTTFGVSPMKKTGVQYVVYSQTFYHGGAGGITVRVNADGTPYIDPDFVPSDTGFTVMEGE